MAWNDLATVVKRVTKGTALTFTEHDANFDNLNAAQAGKAPYALGGSGNPIGYTGAYDVTFPATLRPVEVLAASGTPASCSSTAIDEVLDSFIIPAGVLGVRSIVQIAPVWSFTSSANDKIIKVRIGGTVLYTATRTTSVAEGPLIEIVNRNAINAQLIPYSNGPGYYTAAASVPTTASIDFSVNKTVEFLGQREDAGDTLTLEYFRILHFVGD